MRLDIDGSSVVRRPAVRRHIEGAVSRGLGAFTGRIATIRIRLCERAPTEATRALCGIAVTLEPPDERASAWVLARAEDDDTCRAVDRAVERVAKTLGEEIARRDREAAERASALAIFARRGVVERV
jgi:hypothetical protein